MNKRQKKKKGLLLVEKIYSNWGNKKNKFGRNFKAKKTRMITNPVPALP